MGCATCSISSKNLRYFSAFDESKEGILLPRRGTPASAGYDFYLQEDVDLKPKEICLIPSGVTAYMPEDEYLQMTVRSSLAVKKGVSFFNGIGVIDSDYAGKEIGFVFYNSTSEVVHLCKGERVAQGIFLKYQTVFDDEPLSEKRTGGYGSTGV